ncbi:hypothetical protein RYX36_032298, partial [Vicia faba]
FEKYVWVDNSTLLVCTIPSTRVAPPKKPLVPGGLKIQSNEMKSVIQVRTYQDLLKDEYDEDLFDYYATSQLVLASLHGTTKNFGPPAVYTSLDPSPDEKYIMINSLHRPYSFIAPCGIFPKKVELWSADGKFVRELCDLPLAEEIPITSNSVRKGMRSINWRADKPSTLYCTKHAVFMSSHSERDDQVSKKRWGSAYCYVGQLVASAEAAVEEVIRRGVAHPKKIAVGGHSYGAFMTANLLAHAPHLFCCGIARSGAYNRTLTPFGFQNEDRTLWEATNTYVEMSPFMSANKIKKPILLIHGEEDNNPGTLTMQVFQRSEGSWCSLSAGDSAL